MTNTPPVLRQLQWESASGLCCVSYELHRRRMKSSVCLRMREGRLEVSAPPRTSISAIEDFIRRQSDWILRRQREFQERKACSGLPDTVFEEGGLLPYRGRILTICLGSETPVPLVQFPAPGVPGNLLLPLPGSASHAEVSACIREWLVAEAGRVLPDRLAKMEEFAPRKAASFALSGARHTWGTCSATGKIRLSWRLIYFDNEVVDYVAAHELAHLVEMNHSRRFWEIVRRIRPNYEAARKKLQTIGGLNLPL